MLVRPCDSRAWELAKRPASRRDAGRALPRARLAVEPAPDQERGMMLNTLGVAQYRAGLFHDAAATLHRSLAAHAGRFDAFDLYFLAMALHRFGRLADARACLDRAARGNDQHPGLSTTSLQELAAFRAEAEGLLAARPELPADVFAGPH
jgi:hypothetical protein